MIKKPVYIIFILVLCLSWFLRSLLFNWLGIVCYKHEKFEWAQSLYEIALRLDSGAFSPLHNLGLLEKDRGNYEEAQKIYERIIIGKPLWGLVHKSLGACFQLQGKLREAQREYLRALTLDPRLASAWNNLGVLYFYQGKMERALHCYQEALRLDPNDRITLSNYQRLEQKSGGVL